MSGACKPCNSAAPCWAHLPQTKHELQQYFQRLSSACQDHSKSIALRLETLGVLVQMVSDKGGASAAPARRCNRRWQQFCAEIWAVRRSRQRPLLQCPEGPHLHCQRKCAPSSDLGGRPLSEAADNSTPAAAGGSLKCPRPRLNKLLRKLR